MREQHDARLAVAKAVCIITIVCGHAGLSYPAGTAALGCFFVVSGYLLRPHWLANLPGFALRRMRNLWWPWTWMSLVMLALTPLLNHLGLTTDAYTPLQMPAKAIKLCLMASGLQLMGAYWFVKELLVISFLSVPLLALFRRWPKSVWAMVAVLLLASHVLYERGVVQIFLWLVGTKTLLCMALFLTGYGLSALEWTRRKSLAVGLTAAAVAVGMTSAGLAGNLSLYEEIRCVPLIYLHTLLGTTAYVSLSAYARGPILKALDWVGRHTLEILALHMLLINIVNRITTLI